MKPAARLPSTDGVSTLARLGLDGAVRAAGAATIRRFALVRPDGLRVRGRLPGPALSLSRERLDALVLDGARQAGATLHTGEAATSVEGSLAAGLRPGERRLVDDGNAGTGARQDEGRGAPGEARADDDRVEPLDAHVRLQSKPWTNGPAGLTSVPGRARAAMARSSGMVQACRTDARPSSPVIGLR